MLSEPQATAILEMRLQRLTSMEVQKGDRRNGPASQPDCRTRRPSGHSEKIYALIGQETRELSEAYGNPRKSEISPVEVDGSISLEDLIQEEESWC